MWVKRVGTHRLLYYLLAKYRKPTNLNNYCAGLEKGKVCRGDELGCGWGDRTWGRI